VTSRIAMLAEAMAAEADLQLGPDYCVLDPNWARWVEAMRALGYDNTRDGDIDKMHGEVAQVLAGLASGGAP